VSAQSRSLKDAVALAVKENPRIKAAQANRRATDQVLLQARGRYFPEIELTGDTGRRSLTDQWPLVLSTTKLGIHGAEPD